MPRVAVIDYELCQPMKCGQPCISFCPPVRNKIEAIKVGEKGFPIINEILCIGCGICLDPNTLIATDKGMKPLKDIGVNDKVLTHTGTFKDVKSKALRMYSGKLYRISIEGIPNKIVATEEHPLLVFDGKKLSWKIAADLKEGDWLCSPIVQSLHNTSELTISYGIGSSKVMQRISLNFDGGKKLANLLLNGYSITIKDDIKIEIGKLPTVLATLPENFQKGFLAGLLGLTQFDGRKMYEIFCQTLNDAYVLMLLCLKLGLRTRILESSDNGINFYKVTFLSNTHTQDFVVCDGLRFGIYRVISIETEYVESYPVMNIEVEGDESYTAFGVVVHNCVKKCPFQAITIVKLADELGKDLVHQYGVNSFRLYRLPYLERGKVIGLIGKNGIGKSTAIKILAGKIVPNLGKFEGGISWEDVARMFRGSLVQDYLMKLSEGNIKISYKPQYIDLIPKAVSGKVGEILSKIGSEEKLKKIVKDLGLENLVDRDVSVLSGGELQRLAIAACLLKDANAFLLDEPTSFLDIKQRYIVAAIIRNQASEDKMVMVCDHDLAVLDYMSDKVFVMYGDPGVYGVVAGPYGVREGINIFIEGYIPDENVKFRKERIEFHVKPPTEPIDTTEIKMCWPRIVKKYEQFTLVVEEGYIHPGEVIGIVGPNGIGKTTFIKILAGIEKADTDFQPPLKEISYKPQYPEAVDKKVEDVLKKAAGSKFDTDIYQSEIIDELGLRKLLDRNLMELSGGELQKVSIAEALSRDADIYLIDEPSAYLDAEERYIVAKLLKRITKERKAYTFLVEHDLMVLDFASSRLMVFSGDPGVRGYASKPVDLRIGFNMFLKEMGITFRRDPQTLRPRANKPDSKLDRQQKAIGEYYYIIPTSE